MQKRTPVLCRRVAALVIVLSLRSIQPGEAADAGQTTATALSDVDACTLLTREDAATAVGGTVGEGKSTNVKGALAAKGCSYEGSGLNSITLNMFLFAPGSQQVQVYRGLCAQKEQVAGLGDMACWYNDKHRELQVLKGGTVATIQISRSGDASEPLKAAMKKVVDRLPAK